MKAHLEKLLKMDCIKEVRHISFTIAKENSEEVFNYLSEHGNGLEWNIFFGNDEIVIRIKRSYL